MSMNLRRYYRVVLGLSVWVSVSWGAVALEAQIPDADQKLTEGWRAYQQGDYEMGIGHWKEAQALYRQSQRTDGQIDALRSQSIALRAMGSYSIALDRLQQAIGLAREMDDQFRLMALYEDLAVLLTLTRDFAGSSANSIKIRTIGESEGYPIDTGVPPDAEFFLNESLAMAQALGDRRAEASIYNNLGNYLSTKAYFKRAQESYLIAAQLALEEHNAPLQAQALMNATMATINATGPDHRGDNETAAGQTASIPPLPQADPAAGRLETAAALVEQTLGAVSQLEATHDKVFLLVAVGRAQDLLSERSAGSGDGWIQASFDTYRSALTLAGQLLDRRGACYALEGLAGLYEQVGRYDEALQAANKAAAIAQQSSMVTTLYRLQWQQGRLLRHQNRPQQAISAYRRAVRNLSLIQPQATFGLGNQFPGPETTTSFHKEAGPVLFQYADLLLERTDSLAPDSPEAQSLMREAIYTLERLKTAELADYFQDQCIAQVPEEEIQALARDTAVIYHVPLDNRTEILVDLPVGPGPVPPPEPSQGGSNGQVHPGYMGVNEAAGPHTGIRSRLFKFTVPVGRDQLKETVDRFRYDLGDLTSNRHLSHANDLYDWLIAPIEALLQQHQIEVLVFVPDGPLRSVPMAALYDGQQFLVERYATAVTPGLTLTNPKTLEEIKLRLLICGLTGQDGDQRLPHVPIEIEKLEQCFENPVVLTDERFTMQQIEDQVRKTPFSIVHIASHGKFGGYDDQGQPVRAYLLVYHSGQEDGKMTLTDLERLINMARYRDQPIELLTLSACETAMGDDRAALGLAGIAVKAGARSALATLWSVADESTAQLMAEFYRQIRNRPDLSKAKALQQAQLSLMKNQEYAYDDPYFWSPFLVIGNWQ